MERKRGILGELYQVRDIFAILKEREGLKAEIARCSNSIFQILGQPFSRLCEDFVSHLMRKVDRPGYFTHPVPVDLFPDYPAIAKYPMDFSTILKQIAADRKASPLTPPESLFYPSLSHLYADLRLIPDNARLYNTTTSVFYLAAVRLEAYMKGAFELLQEKLACYGVFGPFDVLNLEGTTRREAKQNWDEFLQNLPEPTPARFEKPFQSSNTLSSSSSSSVSASSSTMKRRGRPPKIRSSSSSSSSFDSGESSSGSISSSSSAGSSNDSISFKRCGRPPKLSPIVSESEEEGEDGKDPVNLEKILQNELKFVWIETAEDVWWPARIVDPSNSDEVIPASLKRLRPQAAAVFWLCQAFDPERQWHWVAKDEAVELTADFEADLEKLEYSPRNRKQIASAHRAALEDDM